MKEEETTDVRQLIHARDDHLFLWNRSASNVLAVALDRGGREGVDKGDPVQVQRISVFVTIDNANSVSFRLC